MVFSLPSNRFPFSITVGIETKSEEEIIIIARDMHKKNTVYIDRKGKVKGYREFILKFPQTPQVLTVFIYNKKNAANPNAEDNSFIITKFDVNELNNTPMWITNQMREFVDFAKWFCENASIISAATPVKPYSTYRSKEGNFCIDYWNKIVDRKTKMPTNTPARIGHNSGIIEVSKADFINYSIPMRMVILLHEFSHKWMNPLSGREIADETGADIHALNCYLSMGYPDLEAEYAFLKVFKHANNAQNHQRYLIIDDFIKRFRKGQLQKSWINK